MLDTDSFTWTIVQVGVLELDYCIQFYQNSFCCVAPLALSVTVKNEASPHTYVARTSAEDRIIWKALDSDYCVQTSDKHLNKGTVMYIIDRKHCGNKFCHPT